MADVATALGGVALGGLITGVTSWWQVRTSAAQALERQHREHGEALARQGREFDQELARQNAEFQHARAEHDRAEVRAWLDDALALMDQTLHLLRVFTRGGQSSSGGSNSGFPVDEFEGALQALSAMAVRSRVRFGEHQITATIEQYAAVTREALGIGSRTADPQGGDNYTELVSARTILDRLRGEFIASAYVIAGFGLPSGQKDA